jgi:hypothetical protein
MRPKWFERFVDQGVVQVALSGNLGFVPLDEVLRLLARAGQTGSVEVRGDDVEGRIFVTQKGVTLATVLDDRELRQHLINSSFVDDAFLRRVESGQAHFEALADNDAQFTDLLRETTVESIYRLIKHGSVFEVQESAETPYAAPASFELEGLLEDVRRRSDEWAEVSRILSDLEGIIQMRRDLGDRDEITVSRDAWKLLSELGAGSSVSTMAARLGTTDFWTAKVAADMAARNLLIISGGRVRVETPEPEDERSEPSAVPVNEAPAERPEWAEEAEAHEGVGQEDDVDPDESWWEDPELEPVEVSGTTEESHYEQRAFGVPTDSEADDQEDIDESSGRFGFFADRRDGIGNGEPAGRPQVESPSQTLAAPQADTHEEEVEEDTEAFLEKVFSDLDKPDDDQSDGHGLLRRRRLGSILQDRTDSD